MAINMARYAPLLHRRYLGGFYVGERPRRVEEKRRPLVLRERKEEDRHMPRTRGLHLRPARERDGIVAWRRLFRRLVEAGAVVALQRRIGIAGCGDERDIGELRAAGSTQVVLREAPNVLISVLVGGTMFPSGMAGVRPRLDHAERIRGRRGGVSRAAGADERVGKRQHVIGPFRLL